MVEVELVTVQFEPRSAILVLRECAGRHRLLPIMIGETEARAIENAVAGRTPPRPMTHDLFSTVLADLGVALVGVSVTELRDRTFYGELRLRGAAGERVVSCRPSDAVALAVRVGSPIFVAQEVIDAIGVEESTPELAGELSDEDVEAFRAFIEQVNPDDFG